MGHFRRRKLNKKTISSIESVCEKLLAISVFKDADKTLLMKEISKGSFELIEYSANETILSPDEVQKKMIIFLSGEAEIYSADENRAVLLKTATKGSVIGVANLFSEDDFVSRITAAKKCEVLEISADKFRIIMEKDGHILLNYVAFLSGRIRYLNRKIVCLTAGSAERRLAYFLEENADAEGKLTLQMNQLCEMLNLGRASLYRAADKLTDEGFIERNGKCIKVLDMTEMMKKYR
jgi:CRP-like cAMP-binding protein